MATACFCGLPADFSRRIFSPTDFFDPLLSRGTLDSLLNIRDNLSRDCCYFGFNSFCNLRRSIINSSYLSSELSVDVAENRLDLLFEGRQTGFYIREKREHIIYLIKSIKEFN